MNYKTVMILFCQPLIQSILESIITSSHAIFGSAYVQLQEEVILISILSNLKKNYFSTEHCKDRTSANRITFLPCHVATSLLQDFKVSYQYGSYKDNIDQNDIIPSGKYILFFILRYYNI